MHLHLHEPSQQRDERHCSLRHGLKQVKPSHFKPHDRECYEIVRDAWVSPHLFTDCMSHCAESCHLLTGRPSTHVPPAGTHSGTETSDIYWDARRGSTCMPMDPALAIYTAMRRTYPGAGVSPVLLVNIALPLYNMRADSGVFRYLATSPSFRGHDVGLPNRADKRRCVNLPHPLYYYHIMSHDVT